MNKEYTTIEEISNYLLLDIAEEFEDQIETWIKAMSEYVRSKTNRDWLADTVASAKYYNGNGKQYANIPDCIQITELATGDDYGANFVARTDYITAPYNSPADGTPITQIILKDGMTFDKGIKNVRITAKWGYAQNVPQDIVFITTVLVAGIVLAQTNQEGEVESERIGNYQVKYVTDSQKSDFARIQDMLHERTLILI